MDKLKDANIFSLFEAIIGGKFGPLLLLEGDAETITNNFNEVMTEVATDNLGFSRPKPHTWTTDDILNRFDTRILLKPQNKTPREKVEHRKVNKQIKKRMKRPNRNGSMTSVKRSNTQSLSTIRKKPFSL